MSEPDPFGAARLLVAAPVAVIATDAAGRIVVWNAHAQRLYGYTADDVIGRPVFDVAVPPELAAQGEAILRQLAQGQPWSGELELRRGDGTVLTIEASHVPLFDERGRYAGALCISTDRSDRTLRQALEEKEALLRTVVQSTPLVLFATDARGVITLSEGRGLFGLGLKPGEAAGRHLDEAYGHLRSEWGGQVTTLRAILERVLAGQEVHATGQFDGREFDCWFVPRRSAAGDVEPGMIGVALDVTERRRLETQLLQAQKMEAVGLLAGGVAHDFNNMLTAIIGYAELLVDALPEGELRTDAAEIRRAAESAAAVASRLLAFTRQQPRDVAPLDLNDTIRGFEQLLRRTLESSIRFVLDLAQGQVRVLADQSQIEQVLLNLVVNARDAMPHGGTLTLRTLVVPAEADGGETAAGAVILEVQDTGTGMDEATAARVFEPFFTTKERGRGTGLGLATVYALVRKAGGDVSVRSTPGAGSTFRIRLPRHQGEAPPAPRPGGRVRPAGGTVLVVEDEDGVRQLAVAVLTRGGYRVLAAASGRAALELVRNGASIDLVLTDVKMPGMTGPDLAAELQRLRPGLRVAFMSGYADDVPGLTGPHLPKPFSTRQLLEAVADALG